MPFAAYWNRLTAATPGLGRDENRMTISVMNFRSAIRRAYEAGQQDAADECDAPAVDKRDFMDVFRDIFRGER